MKKKKEVLIDFDETPDEEALSRLSLNDLGRTPPVPPAEEKRLIKQFIRGKQAARDLQKLKGNQPDEIARLKKLVSQGDEARRTLIEANGRLVINIAAHYAENSEIGLATLAAEGVFGLIRAVDKFDLRKGTRLSTYATPWIRQTISRSIAVHTRMIWLPVYRQEYHKKLVRAKCKYMQEFGVTPDVEILATETGFTPDFIEQLQREDQSVLSLDEPVGDTDDGCTFGDFLADPTLGAIEEAAQSSLVRKKILTVIMATLSPREITVLTLRFGLRDGYSRTLQEVADEIGRTRERVRQIEKAALEKLRRPHCAEQLIDFLP